MDEELKDKQEDSLAMELLKELKSQNKRLMIILLTVISLWFATIGGFIWYLYQYDFSSYIADTGEGGNASIIGDDNGDIVNGDSGIEEKGEEQEK